MKEDVKAKRSIDYNGHWNNKQNLLQMKTCLPVLRSGGGSFLVSTLAEVDDKKPKLIPRDYGIFVNVLILKSYNSYNSYRKAKAVVCIHASCCIPAAHKSRWCREAFPFARSGISINKRLRPIL